MAKLSARDLFDSFPQSARSRLAQGLDRGRDHYHSPELLDQLLWNVVIAMMVKITASAAYDSIKALFRRRGRLDEPDLARHSPTLDLRVDIVIDDDRLAHGHQQISVTLQSAGLSPEDARDLANQALETVRLLAER